MISPSIIAGASGIGEKSLIQKIEVAEKYGADMIHLDVMDGKFVPNTTFSFDMIKNLRGITKLPFDTHLMIENPDSYLDSYIDAGCDIITIHGEVCKSEEEFERMNSKMLSNGVSPGFAINPGTSLPDWILSHLNNLDVLIIMSVNPGFAGQKFIPEVLPKMKDLISKLRANGYRGYIEADGGIDQSTIVSCYEAGCRIFVMGNAIFGSEDVAKRISETKFKLDSNLEQTLLDKSQEMNVREDWIKGRKTILDRYEIKGV